MPGQSIRGAVPALSIRALYLVLPPTFLARGRIWFIIPLRPRHGAYAPLVLVLSEGEYISLFFLIYPYIRKIRSPVPGQSIRALEWVLPPTLSARGAVPARSIRALLFSLPPTFLARVQTWFIVPLRPRHGAYAPLVLVL